MEIGEVELDARVLDPMSQHIEHAVMLHVTGQALEESVLDIRAIVLLQPLPFFRLVA